MPFSPTDGPYKIEVTMLVLTTLHTLEFQTRFVVLELKASPES